MHRDASPPLAFREGNLPSQGAEDSGRWRRLPVALSPGTEGNAAFSVARLSLDPQEVSQWSEAHVAGNASENIVACETSPRAHCERNLSGTSASRQELYTVLYPRSGVLFIFLFLWNDIKRSL